MDTGTAEPRWSRALRRPSLLGLVLGTWFVTQSVTPSLLVRSWFFQGVLTGVSFVVGYAVGLGLTRLVVHLRSRSGRPHRGLDPALDRRLRWLVLALCLAWVAWAAVGAVDAHRWTWERLGYARSSYGVLFGGTVALACVVALVLFVIGRLLKIAWRLTTKVGTRMLPAWIAGGLALVLVGWAVLASLNTFVLERTLDGLNSGFALGDQDLGRAPDPPTSRVRSGGPESEVVWEEAGREGRRFLTRGPTTEDLEELATGDVVEPVRVFVGRASADTVEERVALAMSELERFGGFDREAILVVVPTGTGWINEQLVQSLEFFHDGDIATVTVQYSHLPSPLAFISESAAAGDTAVALFEAVEERIADSAAGRPDLYIAGESLGSFGGSQIFDSLADSRERVDGAVWVGPPETMRLRREAERTRTPGSLQVRPVVGDGESFVFANRVGDLAGTSPHSVFLQHGDDPIVWWDWDTLADEPDWLEEPLDPAVNPAIRWAPVTTFLQLAVDMAVSNDFDEDHGHKYGTQPVDAWFVVVQPDGWDQERLGRLRERMSSISR